MTAEAAQAAPSGDTISAPSAETSSDDQRIDTTRSAVASTQPIRVASAAPPDGDTATAIAKPALALKPADVPQPASSEDKSPVTPAAPQEPSAKSWSVQIASTQDDKAAQQLQDKLKTLGYDAYIVEADVNSARWFRVRVGRFTAQQEADATRKVLQSKENIRSAFVTAK